MNPAHSFPPLLILIGSILALKGCAKQPARPTTTSEAVQVRVEHVAKDVWHVTYEVPAATHAIVFPEHSSPSGRHDPRPKRWRILGPPTAQMTKISGMDIITARQPFRRLDLEIHTHVLHDPPELFTTFSDGGILLYTAKLNLTPLSCANSASCTASEVQDATKNQAPNRFILVRKDSERLILEGRLAPENATWASSTGTFVYFGPSIPVRRAGLAAVIDSAFPPWLREQLDLALPKFIDFFTTKTGQKLPFEPTVYLAYGEEEQPYSSAIGGAVEARSLVFDFRLGKALGKTGDKSTLATLTRVVGHEAAHLWNNEMFKAEEHGGSWLHEGGAEAFAIKAMRELGIVSPSQYDEFVSDRASACAQEVGLGALADDRPGHYRDYYDCGVAIAVISEAALRQHNPEADLFTLWAALFREATPKQYYDQALYWRVLAEKTDWSTTHSIASLVNSPLRPRADAKILETFKSVSVSAEFADDSASTEFNKRHGLAALRELLDQDCAKPPLLRSNRGAIQVDSADACRTRSSSFQVTRVGGLLPLTSGLKTYDSIDSSCRQRRPVELEIAGESFPLRIPCSHPLPGRAHYIRITGAP